MADSYRVECWSVGYLNNHSRRKRKKYVCVEGVLVGLKLSSSVLKERCSLEYGHLSLYSRDVPEPGSYGGRELAAQILENFRTSTSIYISN
jgi:hypothetical protein